MKKGPHPVEAIAPVAPKLGLRERNKLNKAQLIRDASRQLFFEKGYEATTLREVAALADVGFGTVSAYATDKAGLLAMLFVEDLDHLPGLFDESHNDDDVIDQLTEAFAHLYEFWARRAELSRIVLPQMEFYNSNRFTEEILRRRQQLQKNLALWLKTCQKSKRIKAKVDTDQAAALLFAIYTSALREWIIKDPLDIKQGLARLHYLLAIPMAAIAA
jgi:AcrR family transcriptional regulator